MEKKDLKTGMVVETRAGEKYVVFKDIYIYQTTRSFIGNIYGFRCFCDYNTDLTVKNKRKKFDIMKVYTLKSNNIFNALETDNNLILIWERKKEKEEKQKPQLTERERAYLKAYSYDYEWIARDADGDLYIYENQPIKDNYHEQYNDQDGKYINISDISGVILSFIKWEDEEPYNIKELLGEE